MSALKMVCKMQKLLFPKHLECVFLWGGELGWFFLFVSEEI